MNTTTRRLLAIAICLAACINVRAGLEETSLHLKNGSLIESIYFRRAWLKENPAEDAIVVARDTAAQGNEITSAAVCAYSKAGKVFIHSGSGTLSADLAPADLFNVAKVRAAVDAMKILESTATEGDDVGRALSALSNETVMGIMFPADASEFTWGSLPRGKYLAFDWNYAHYIYAPERGVFKITPPVNPITGQPYLCVPFTDAVEAITFVYEYRKMHPDERAYFMGMPDNVFREPTSYLAYALYSAGGKRTIYSPVIDGRKVDISKAVRDDGKVDARKCFNAYQDALHQSYPDLFRSSDSGKWPLIPTGALEEGGKIFHQLQLSLAVPQSLPGDTPKTQMGRVMARFVALGVPAWRDFPLNARKDWAYAVGFRTGDQYLYAYRAQTGSWTSNYSRGECAQSLIYGLVFKAGYEKANPTEKAVLIRPVGGVPSRDGMDDKGGEILCFRTQKGKVFLHDSRAGDIKMAGFSAADLGDHSKQGELCKTALGAINDEFMAVYDRFGAFLLRNKNRRDLVPPDFPDLQYRTTKVSAADAFTLLQDAGVKCRLIPTVERGEDGVAHKYPANAVAFEWNGRVFTYSDAMGCSANSGYFQIQP